MSGGVVAVRLAESAVALLVVAIVLDQALSACRGVHDPAPAAQAAEAEPSTDRCVPDPSAQEYCPEYLRLGEGMYPEQFEVAETLDKDRKRRLRKYHPSLVCCISNPQLSNPPAESGRRSP